MFLLLVVLAAVAGLAWWASRVTLTSAVPEVGPTGTAAAPAVWAQASAGSVGRSLPLSTTLRQPARPVAQNTLTGVVTSVSSGDVDDGDVVYVVGRTPVRVVEAAEPFWRDLVRDAAGKDVVPLQRLLIADGHLSGEADGTFGPATEGAVKEWQKNQGVDQTGVVTLGELVAVADLPAVVALGESIGVGRTLAGGEDAVLAPTGERQFVLVVTAEQGRLIPAEASVEVTYEDHTWTAVIARAELDEFGSTTFTLTAPDGGEVCGQECGVLPNDAQVTLRSDVVIVPKVQGTTVPAAAVRTRADGTAYLITPAGQVEVSVAASGQGLAVVEGEGIKPGTRVEVMDGGMPSAPPQRTPVPGDDADSTQKG